MITEDKVAPIASREQEYERLARSIGLPERAPSWWGVLITACLAVMLGVLGSAVWIWAQFGHMGQDVQGTATMEGVATGMLVVAAVLAAVCGGLIVLSLLSETRKAVRQQELARIVAKYPDFAVFYEQWCWNAQRTGRRQDSQWSERLVGPRPPRL